MALNYDEINFIKGIKNDEDQKDIPMDYLFNIENYNYSNESQNDLEKILMPKKVNYISDEPNTENWLYQTFSSETTSRGQSVTWDGEKFILLFQETKNIPLQKGTYSIKTSTDGKNWDSVDLPFTEKELFSIAYGNNTYVIVGDDTTGNDKSILYSTDLETWNEIVAPNSHSWEKVKFLNNKFIALADTSQTANNIMYSDDGLSWNIIITGFSLSYGDVTYGNSKFLVVGGVSLTSSNVIYSSDLSSWTQALNDSSGVASSRILKGVVYANNQFIAVGGDNTQGLLYNSSNGIIWTDNRSNIYDARWESVTYGNGYFIACSSSTDRTFTYSTDGLNWTDIIISTGVDYDCEEIIYENRIFISSAYQGIFSNGNNDDKAVDGLFEYRFLDENNVLQTQYIGVSNGKIYKDILTIPVLLRSGITAGKCSFAVLNDKLYIANGKDYVYVYDGAKGIVSQMGAPISSLDGLGVLNGEYYYAITFVTAGREEYVGSVSNTLTTSNNKILLDLPLGYSGTTSRKIYRTTAGGTTLKLLTTIADNTTLTYSDNNADGTLTTNIINVNNELPKPYFISVFNERIIGAKVDSYPTQIFITDTEIDVFSLADGLDIANYAADNSRVVGLGIDFSNVIVGTEKHIYLVEIGTSITITTTRVNVGFKDGYSVVRVPTYGNFSGGLVFVSNNNDVRILVGLRALPVATSIDNISSENIATNIRGTLLDALNSPSNIYAEYFEYKYHLVVDGKKFVYDIRNNAWTYHNIQTTNYTSNPNVLAVLNNNFYNGQNTGEIEQEYAEVQYKNEEVTAVLESGNLKSSNIYKNINKFIYWFLPSETNELELQIIADDDIYFADEEIFEIKTGAYRESDYVSSEYTIADELDYRVYNVYKPVRWIRWKLLNTKGNIIFNKWGLFYKNITGQE